MSPRVRAAAHAALDMVLDAIAEDEAARVAPPMKRTRTVRRPPVPAQGTASPEARAQVERALSRAGFR